MPTHNRGWHPPHVDAGPPCTRERDHGRTARASRATRRPPRMHAHAVGTPVMVHVSVSKGRQRTRGRKHDAVDRSSSARRAGARAPPPAAQSGPRVTICRYGGEHPCEAGFFGRRPPSCRCRRCRFLTRARRWLALFSVNHFGQEESNHEAEGGSSSPPAAPRSAGGPVPFGGACWVWARARGRWWFPASVPVGRGATVEPALPGGGCCTVQRARPRCRHVRQSPGSPAASREVAAAGAGAELGHRSDRRPGGQTMASGTRPEHALTTPCTRPRPPDAARSGGRSA
jgi:hypothetical protein